MEGKAELRRIALDTPQARHYIMLRPGRTASPGALSG